MSHNVETVRRLTPLVRSRSSYDRSLSFLRIAREIDPRQRDQVEHHARPRRDAATRCLPPWTIFAASGADMVNIGPVPAAHAQQPPRAALLAPRTSSPRSRRSRWRRASSTAKPVRWSAPPTTPASSCEGFREHLARIRAARGVGRRRMIEISRREAAAPRSARIHRVLHVRDISAGAFVLRFSAGRPRSRPASGSTWGCPAAGPARVHRCIPRPGGFPGGAGQGDPRTARFPRPPALPGDALEVEGPHGSFTLVEGARESARFLFLRHGNRRVAFSLLCRSSPGLDYLLLHGIRSPEERMTVPRSRTAHRAVHQQGRRRSARRVWAAHGLPVVTPVDPSRYCYLCGNSDMIYETYALLRDSGVPHSQIFAEVYF